MADEIFDDESEEDELPLKEDDDLEIPDEDEEENKMGLPDEEDPLRHGFSPVDPEEEAL